MRYLIGLLLSLFVTFSYAGGGITHMFIAEESIPLIPDPHLRNLLLNNLEAYLVGADYPDSGYVPGAHYGEDSHWDPFIYAFSDYIKEKYSDPESQNPKLVAFLFGCASHRVSDEMLHSIFYNEMAREDFQGNVEKAHQYGDVGIDLELVIDEAQWRTHPKTWWVPVNDMVQIYQRMGKSYPAEEIKWGNTVLFFAGYSERLIALPAYPKLQWKMPWTSRHYYHWPKGGLLINEKEIVQYQMALWQRLKGKLIKEGSALPAIKSGNEARAGDQPMIDLAQKIIESKAVHIPILSNADGSIELQIPVIKNMKKYDDLLTTFEIEMPAHGLQSRIDPPMEYFNNTSI